MALLSMTVISLFEFASTGNKRALVWAVSLLSAARASENSFQAVLIANRAASKF